MNFNLLFSVLAGISILLLLIVRAKWQAFISLLIAAITVGLLAGMPADQILKSIEKGMGSTLGYVATIVGLGAIFGGILEKTQASQVVARKLLALFGQERASWALALAGFMIAIPVFFDVAFIILYPVLTALSTKARKHILHFALPLLAGLAVGHTFIPPTPGPIAVASIIGADLGWVILAGLLVGFPTALIAGIWFGRLLAKRITLAVPQIVAETHGQDVSPPASVIFGIILLPIFLILLNTCINADLFFAASASMKHAALLIGHPFTALILANMLAWYLLGKRMGFSAAQLTDISTKSFQPAGIIILVTGAGGVFKQILIDTGAGEMIARSAESAQIPMILFAFLAAAFIRVLQGSATVAMATGASIVAPLVAQSGAQGLKLAAVVMAIAAGASILSHVNDSGFWLVKEYLGLTEKQTFQSWSAMTTILALVGFSLAAGLYWLA